MIAERSIVADPPPLPPHRALGALVRCGARTAALLAGRRLSLPRDRVGTVLEFADGTHGRVYRETQISRAPTDAPAQLVDELRLRWVRGAGHALFRAESLLIPTCSHARPARRARSGGGSPP